MPHIYNLLLHIYNLFPACKTCCCIHRTFSQTCITRFPNVVYLCLILCYFGQNIYNLSSDIQLCRTLTFDIQYNTSFVKLILKVHNLAPNMCVNIANFFDIFVQLAIDWKFGLSIDRPTHHSLRSRWQKRRLKLFLIWSDFYSAIVTVRDGTPLSVP